MSKKDNSPAISFFSFQDIITSVTGIMFLVVIMLVLMMLCQKSSSAQQKEKDLFRELTQLEQQAAELKDAIAKLRKQSAEQDKRIEELKKLKLETLPEMKKEWIRKLRALNRGIAFLEEEKQQLKDDQKKQISLALEKKAHLVRNQDEIRKQEDFILSLAEKIRHKTKLFNKIKNVIRFVWNKSNPKKPVLLECSEKSIVASSLNDFIKRQTFSSYTQCLDFCKKLPPAETYFILLLKPSAFSYAEKFSLDLQKAGFERGKEVLPGEETLISEETK